MTADSVSPLAALDVSAARNVLDALANMQTLEAKRFRRSRDMEELAQDADARATTLRRVSAALSSLPALLADGARLATICRMADAREQARLAVEDEQRQAGLRGELRQNWQAPSWLLYVNYRDALDESITAAARAVRPAGAAPTGNVK